MGHNAKPTEGNTERLTLSSCFNGFSGTLQKISGVFFALFSPESRHTPLLAQNQGIVYRPKTRGIAVFSPKGGLFHHKGRFLLNRRFKGREKTH
jgi:hypothetical protein